MVARAKRTSNSSMSSEAQDFNTHGGLLNSATRNLHVRDCHRTNQGDGAQQQLPTAGTLPPNLADTSTGNVHEEKIDATPGRPSTSPLPWEIHADVQQDHGKLVSDTQEELPSNSTTVFFPAIPIELVERILNQLDLLSVLKCRYVCSAFRQLIDSSPYFQWNMELAIAGKEDSGDYPLSVSRRMLAQHQSAWTGLQWTKELLVEVLSDRWSLGGGVLEQFSQDKSTIYFKRLPSQSRNIEERDWTVDVGRFKILRCLIDPVQDLLIIFDDQVDRLWNGDKYQIFLLTASSGDPHPSATATHILTHTLTDECLPRYKGDGFQIYEDILGVMFNVADSGETEIVFWNWKTGSKFVNLLSDYPTVMSFLSRNYVMFSVQTQGEPCLIVVDIATLTTERQRLQEVENIFTFHLPPFADTVHGVSIDIHSDMAPACKSNPNLSVPFFTALTIRNRLHLITLLVHSGSLTHQLQLYALSHTFLSLIDMAAGQKAADFDWHMWGPEGTRMVLSSPGSHLSLGQTIGPSGTTYVCTGQPHAQPVDRIHIYDFNQYALGWSGKNQQETSASSYAVFTAPTKIADNEIFQGEIETRLGYRTKCWVIPGEPKARFPVCVEDAIVILEGERKLRIFTA